MKISRRDFNAAALGGALLPLSGKSWAQPAKPTRMAYNTAGGSQEKGVRDVYLDPFTAETGIPVVTSSPHDFGKLRAMVESNSVIWDVAEIAGQDILRAEQMKLFEPIDPAIVDRSEFVAEAMFPTVLSSFVYSTIIGYNKEEFSEGPASWAEFWDFDKFPGQRSMRNHPTVNLEAALLADGVAVADLYPLDVDRAFRKLEEIAKKTIWSTAGAQPPQAIIDREVSLAVGWNGRFYTPITEGAPIGLSWAQGALMLAGLGIPRGGPNVEWSQRLIAEFAKPEKQAKFGVSQAYSGTHKRSAEYMPAEIAEYLPLHPANAEKQWWVNLEWWMANGDAMMERWNKWMLSHQG